MSKCLSSSFRVFSLLILMTLRLWPDGVQAADLPSLPEDYTMAVDPLPGELSDIAENPDVAVVAISPNGKLLVAGDLRGILRIWDVESCNLLKVIKIESKDESRLASPSYITATTFGPDGRWLAAGGRDRAIRLWEISSIPSTRESAGFIAHQGHIRALAYSPNGQYLASSGHDGKIRLWDVKKNMEEFAVLHVSNQLVFSFAFSPGGRMIVSTGVDDSVGLWDLESRVQVRRYSIIGGRARGVAYSPNGEMVAAAIEGGLTQGWKEDRPTVRVWSTRSGKEIQSFRAHDERAMAIAFGINGLYIASGGIDGIINIWKIETGELVNKMTIEKITAMEEYKGRKIEVLVQGDGSVQSLHFSSDGQFIVSGGYGQIPRLWDWHAGKVVKEFRLKGCESPFRHK